MGLGADSFAKETFDAVNVDGKQYAVPFDTHPIVLYYNKDIFTKAGRHAEAEAVYRRDLEEYPHNGWSMAGLAGALEAQGETHEAKHLREHFEHVRVGKSGHLRLFSFKSRKRFRAFICQTRFPEHVALRLRRQEK